MGEAKRVTLRLMLQVVLLGACLLLTGCDVDLYQGLQEQEANEILAVLLENEIPVSKEAGEEGTWNILVEEKDFARAMKLLNARGLPRPPHQSMGEIFAKSGIMSSPLEEKARYIYALSQELSETLSSIDGVLQARVHIVLAQENELGEFVSPASVSVFIRHTEDATDLLQRKVEDIKEMVGNSVEGVSPEHIHLSFYLAQPPAPGTPSRFYDFLGIRVARGSVKALWAAFGSLGVLLVAALGGMAYLWRNKRTGTKASA